MIGLGKPILVPKDIERFHLEWSNLYDMNTPTPAPATATDPTTPGPQTRPTALGSAATSALAGTPLAIVIVISYEHLFHVTLDSVSATAVGSVGASVIGYLWRVVQAVLAKKGIDPGN